MGHQQNELDMGFTNTPLPEKNHHVCMIFDSDDQRQKIVSEYLAAGLRERESVRYIADTVTPEEVRSWLVQMGVEIPDNVPLNIHGVDSFYFPSGRFEPQLMIQRMVSRLETIAKEAYYSGSRVCGEMNWVLRDIPGTDRLLEYEALLNTVKATIPFTGMCLYDARLFDGATLFKVLQVHPYMVAQGQIVRNPYYMRADEVTKQRGSTLS